MKSYAFWIFLLLGSCFVDAKHRSQHYHCPHAGPEIVVDLTPFSEKKIWLDETAAGEPIICTRPLYDKTNHHPYFKPEIRCSPAEMLTIAPRYHVRMKQYFYYAEKMLLMVNAVGTITYRRVTEVWNPKTAPAEAFGYFERAGMGRCYIVPAEFVSAQQRTGA